MANNLVSRWPFYFIFHGFGVVYGKESQGSPNKFGLRDRLIAYWWKAQFHLQPGLLPLWRQAACRNVGLCKVEVAFAFKDQFFDKNDIYHCSVYPFFVVEMGGVRPPRKLGAVYTVTSEGRGGLEQH